MNLCRRAYLILLIAAAAGCQNPMRTEVMKNLELEHQELAALRADMDHSAEQVTARHSVVQAAIAAPEHDPNEIHLVSASQPEQPAKKASQAILTLPDDLPFSKAPLISLPKDKAELDKTIQKLYPPLPPLEEDRPLAPGPEGRPMTLADLQRLASQYSPAIKSAESAVEAARGALRQSTAYPNPTFSYEIDTAQTGPAGYPGFSIEQVIKTGNKLQLQGAAATMDLFNAQLALRKARHDLAYQVRSNYFATLIALENVKVSRAFARFTDQIYAVQVKILKGNEAAAYEPMQLRPLALAARFNLHQAIYQYRASWRQLAASLGLPDMPPSELAGSPDLPVPRYQYDEVLDYILKRNSDVLTAKNLIYKGEYQVKLARVQPVPDVDLRLLIQKDYTTAPFNTVHSLQASIPLPTWDQNKGNIYQAESFLMQARQNLAVTQNTLTATLAEAFGRFETNKKQVEITQEQLKDQIRVYQHVRKRYYSQEGQVSFGDVVTAQQTLAGFLTNYISALSSQWTAVLDVAHLLQRDDLFESSAAEEEQVPSVRPLAQLEFMDVNP